METYIDEDLLQYELIWAAAGTPKAVFELTPNLLKELTGGTAVDVKARPLPPGEAGSSSS